MKQDSEVTRPNLKTLATGALAGLTAALLVLGASMQPSFSAVLYAASALPILLVGLGWGNAAAISAVVTAAVLGAIAISPSFALVMTLVTLLPAGWLSHLANLARPASELGGLFAAETGEQRTDLEDLPLGRHDAGVQLGDVEQAAEQVAHGLDGLCDLAGEPLALRGHGQAR